MLSCTVEFDSTVAFYRDVLGLTVTQPRPAMVDSNFSRYAVAVLPDGGTLEIVEPTPASCLQGRQILCLRVADIRPAMRDLQARGARIVSGLFDNGEGLGWVYIQA